MLKPKDCKFESYEDSKNRPYQRAMAKKNSIDANCQNYLLNWELEEKYKYINVFDYVLDEPLDKEDRKVIEWLIHFYRNDGWEVSRNKCRLKFRRPFLPKTKWEKFWDFIKG